MLVTYHPIHPIRFNSTSPILWKKKVARGKMGDNNGLLFDHQINSPKTTSSGKSWEIFSLPSLSILNESQQLFQDNGKEIDISKYKERVVVCINSNDILWSGCVISHWVDFWQRYQILLSNCSDTTTALTMTQI